MKSIKKISNCVFIVALLWLMQACAILPLAETQLTPSFEAVERPLEGKYFFVEIWVHMDGVSMTISRSLYSFDPITGALTTRLNAEQFPLENWGFVGKGVSALGSARGLTIVSSLPYENNIGVFTGNLDEYGNPEFKEVPIKLLELSTDGKLSLEIDGQSFILAINEKWEHSDETDFIRDGIEHHYQITSSITNYGWFDRNRIQYAP